MENEVNVYHEGWLEVAIDKARDSHLLCTGKSDDLQWFGTHLIQGLGKQPNSEISPIYGKLAKDFDDFCYQLCRSTPFGFEMGRNFGAVNDVIRGHYPGANRYFIIYDAHYLYLQEYRFIDALLSLFCRLTEEQKEREGSLRVIMLFEDLEKISTRKLMRRKEKHPIEALKIIQEP